MEPQRKSGENKLRNRKILPWLFGTLGAVLAAAALMVCLAWREAEPVMARYPQEAEQCVSDMMQALDSGDFHQASQYLYGTPTLGSGLEEGDIVAARLWDSFADSLRCTPQGRCYATPEGLAQNITVTSLDIGQVLQAIKTTAPRLLEQQVARAEDMSEVYADDNTYRQDFLLDVMLSAANAALTEAPARERSLTVHLQYRDRQWWVLPEQTLLEAVSGGILE